MITASATAPALAGARAGGPRTIGKLTPCETEVLRELVEGEPNKLIASRLGSAEATIEIHVTRILEKSCARSRVDLAILFRRDA